MAKFNKSLIMSYIFHIHKRKIIGLYYEQSAKDIFSDAEKYEQCNRLYVDYIIKKCRCGNISKKITSIYTADRTTMPISPLLQTLQLTNKIHVVKKALGNMVL